MRVLSIIGDMTLSEGGPPEVLRNQFSAINKEKKIIYLFNLKFIRLLYLVRCFIFRSYRKKIYRLLKKYDIIHFHELWTFKAIFFVYFANKLGIKHFYVGHGYLDPWSIKQGYIKKKLFIKFFLQYAYNSASAAFFSTFDEYIDARKNLKIHSPFIIPNGINLSRFKKRILSKKASKKKIIFFGRIHKKKGLEILLKTITKLPDNFFNNFTFEITGPGQRKDVKFIKNLIINYKIEKRVNLNNPVISDQKVNYLSKHDIFILPSFEEGDSIALKEALASYLPVVISKQCRMDIVEDYNAGIVIDTNVESLYKALLSLDSLDLIKMGYQARKLIEEKYNNINCSLRLLDIYKNIYCGSRISSDWLNTHE